MIWEIQKQHWNFSRPIGSWVIDWNNILHILIINTRIAWPTEIWMVILSFLDKLIQGAYYYFTRKCW